MALDLWGPNGGERLASLTYVPEFYRTKGPEILPVVSLAHDLCNHFTRNRRNPHRKNFTAFFSVATFTTEEAANNVYTECDGQEYELSGIGKSMPATLA